MRLPNENNSSSAMPSDEHTQRQRFSCHVVQKFYDSVKVKSIIYAIWRCSKITFVLFFFSIFLSRVLSCIYMARYIHLKLLLKEI